MKELMEETKDGWAAHRDWKGAPEEFPQMAAGHCTIDLTACTYLPADRCLPAGQVADRGDAAGVQNILKDVSERAMEGENPRPSQLEQEK